MHEYIEREAALCIAEYAEDEHPYKVPQVPETYSDYNQGWSDACAYIREKLEGSKAADVEPVTHGNMSEEQQIEKVEINFYDQEEIYENCTVQVLTNTTTGDVSVGWWQNEGEKDNG